MKKQDITAERKSIFDHEMLEVMKHLMQCVHMNNLHIHKCFKEHKTKIDLAEVKTGLIRVFPNKIIQCLSKFTFSLSISVYNNFAKIQTRSSWTRLSRCRL